MAYRIDRVLAAGRLSAAWTVPFVSICADVGLVTAMTPDGGILEGRAD